MKKKELKIKSKSDFKIVQEAVNSFDLYGLIKGGAPEDEYDFLTDIILTGIYRDKSIDELRKILINEMVTSFGPMKCELNTEHNKELDEFLEDTKNKIKKPDC